MESIINNLQEDYINIPITGLFLIYPKYFVHVIEAAEDIIYRHFRAINNYKSEKSKIKRAIYLPTYHHVHQRFFSQWSYVYSVPPSLIQPFTSFELDDILHQMSNCFRKIYILCDHISNTIKDSSIPMNEVVKTLNEKFVPYYPESTLLEYLLNIRHPVILTIDDYLNIFSITPTINLYPEYLQYQKNVFFYGIHEICITKLITYTNFIQMVSFLFFSFFFF
ncbi:LOW QUALITY PROTEIN: uncharacterized protein LOC113218775 [Apis mellifera]|uniref:LOW QUALITY PROTEIN: uncharacterized protein LOC113218775 n=1 Tax=Apis mellifera TaxID=7460 RepID=A0A7M7L260_APIME|nr:LOW QUALITY PROTEIN: uncharacterized protein LOC113218775 [Apis mellifera]|eukprot:XP_026296515.1 LOW QUALITY PROTEIN: uncharacterized protein LOC113218775 [Apis mellifera]